MIKKTFTTFDRICLWTEILRDNTNASHTVSSKWIFQLLKVSLLHSEFNA